MPLICTPTVLTIAGDDSAIHFCRSYVTYLQEMTNGRGVQENYVGQKLVMGPFRTTVDGRFGNLGFPVGLLQNKIFS